MDAQGVEDVILDLLAEDLGLRSDEVRAELLAAGEELPVDSLLLVEILVRLEEHFGCRIPETPEIAKAMTSVSTFAAAVAELLAEGGTREPAANQVQASP